MRTLLSCIALTCAACGATPKATPDALDRLTVPPLPDWTDRYVEYKIGDHRRFNISAVMKTHELSRLEAVELQNHYLDLARARPEAEGGALFAEALARVKEGELESGLDPKALQAAPFIVVFDLDETLYDQRNRRRAECHEVSYERADGEKKYFHPVPGWSEAIHRVRSLGGLVVIFSANEDESTQENLRHWKLDGKPLLGHPDIAGVMTNSHLIIQDKIEGRGAQNPRKGRPILEPSKDLRIFDKTLERVIIVDDNPKRLFQRRNVRQFKKFHADEYCFAEDRDLKTAYGKAMSVVLDEITEARAWQAGHEGSTFAAAYLPYSMAGRVTVSFLQETMGWDEVHAREYVRANPKLVSRK